MRDRKFGVEIECGHPHGPDRVRSLLHGILPQWFSHPTLPCTVGVDGSGVEARTPPLQGIQGFKELKIAMEAIRVDGGYVSNSDGMHVHHDAPEFAANPALAILLARNWAAHEGSIEQFVESRRWGRGSCPRVWGHPVRTVVPETRYSAHPQFIEQDPIDLMQQKLEQGGTPNEIFGVFGGRGALNLSCLRRSNGPTIELRLHEGTLDFDQAEAWIRFGQRFIEAAAQGKRIMACPDPDTLLKKIRTTPRATERLLARVPARQLQVV